MRKRHLRGVVAIERQTNPRPWSSGLFAGELRLATSREYVVALHEGVVVGFGGLMYTGHEAHLTNVAVDPAWQRRRVGTRIMWVLLDRCRARGVDDVTLEVRMSNTAARELYRRFGFVPGGVRPGYYADTGEDALIMWAHDLQGAPMAERLAARAAEVPGIATAGFHDTGSRVAPR